MISLLVVCTLALDGKNRIWSWGGNDSGVLGRDTSQAKEVLKDIDGKNGNDDDDDDDDEDGDLNEAESTPALVENLPEGEIVQLAATDNLSAALLSNGDVYAWGVSVVMKGYWDFER